MIYIISKGASGLAEKIVITSGKGGVGKTTCCVAIGDELASRGYSVLLVDTDVGLRSIDELLHMSQRIVYDWGDMILGRCKGEDAVVVSSENLDLLTCPLQYDDAFTPENLKKVIEEFDADYDFILIDSPAGIDIGFENAAAAADRAIVVSTSDSVCVRSAARAGDKLYDMGINDVRLIINRFRKKSVINRKFLNIDDVIDKTMIQLIGVVPEDEELTFGSIMEKRTQASFSPFVRIVNRILKKEEKLILNF